MKRLTGVILMILALLVHPAPVLLAATNPPLLIVALQTGGAQNARQEFVMIANTTSSSVDLSTVKLEYFPASAKILDKPSRSFRLEGSLAGAQTFTIATDEYTETQAQQRFSATLAAAGGHLKLTGPGYSDTVGWGTASNAIGDPALAPATGETLRRLQNNNGQYVSTNNNAQDFTVGEPQTVDSSLPDVANLRLSELLPDPASPILDSTGEFIEIQNIDSESADLNKYVLAVGTSTIKKYTLPPIYIEPGGFAVWYAPDTKLTLANGGGRVQLLSPGGVVLDDVAYPVAQVGQSWVRNDLFWQWTSELTPGKLNVVNALPSSIKTTAGSSLKSSTKKSTKQTTKSKAKKAAAKGQVKSASTDTSAVVGNDKADQKTPLHGSVVAGVGGLAVLYGVYEYWDDLKSKVQRFRRNREDREESG